MLSRAQRRETLQHSPSAGSRRRTDVWSALMSRARLLGRLDEERPQVAQRRSSRGRGRRARAICRAMPLRLRRALRTSGWPRPSGRPLRRGEFDASSANAEAAKRTTAEHTQRLAARPDGDGELAGSLRAPRPETRRAAQRTAQPERRPRRGARAARRRRLQAQLLGVAVPGVEGHAVIAEIGARPVDREHDQLGLAPDRRHVAARAWPHARGARRAGAGASKIAAAAQEGGGGTREDAERAGRPAP